MVSADRIARTAGAYARDILRDSPDATEAVELTSRPTRPLLPRVQLSDDRSGASGEQDVSGEQVLMRDRL